MTPRQRILKAIYPLIMLKGKLFPSKIDVQKNVLQAPSTSSIYDLELVLNNGFEQIQRSEISNCKYS